MYMKWRKKVEEVGVDQVVAYFEALRAANGGLLHPAQLAEASRDPQALLHEAFTWDDTKAAQLRRIDEARGLIR